MTCGSGQTAKQSMQSLQALRLSAEIFTTAALKRVRDGEEANYITAALGVYLSLFNVFQSLLLLLGIGGQED